jgi:DNA-binding MarR family transcriptional regulator
MPRKKAEPPAEGWDGLDGFEKLLGHRGRLGICVLLARNDQLSFRRLKELLQETDGNLGAQLRKLEDEGYLEVNKEFQDRKPISWYGLTGPGRNRLDRHLDALKRLINTGE